MVLRLPKRQPKNPPSRALAVCVLVGAIAMTAGGYGPWAHTGSHTVWGSNSGGAGVGTAGLAAAVLAVLVVGGRRWPASLILLLGAFSAAATAYYLLDPATVVSDAGLKGHATRAWGLYVAFAGSAVTTAGALVVARLRKRRPRA